MGQYGSKKEEIVKLLKEGLSYNEIRVRVGCAKSTIAYHADKLGLSGTRGKKLGPPKKYNWAEIQAYYDGGHSVAETRRNFGFSAATWNKAKLRGDVIPRKKFKTPLSEILVENSSYNRGDLKRRIVEEGLLEYKCSMRGCVLYNHINPTWGGEPITLIIDHINGVNNDNRLENLRFLCPNCNSQTDTFAGRNCKGNYAGPNLCLDCEAEIGRKSTRCTKCANKLISAMRKVSYKI